MKIVIIGATGTIGKAIVNELKPRHEIISAGHNSGDIQVDITNQDSIDELYQKIKNIDAIILVTGKVHFGALKDMKENNYELGLGV